MSKKPCYTCQEPFINTKLEYLLNRKKNEAIEFAKKNNYTGSIAIVALADNAGFVFVEAERKTANQRATEYLLFDNGTAI